MSYNRNFDLNIRDIELIELALNDKLKRLSINRLTFIESTIKPESELESVKRLDQEIKEINSLLGKLHNQKLWNRLKITMCLVEHVCLNSQDRRHTWTKHQNSLLSV